MKKKVKVGLFGGALASVNYGVTAITFAQIALLHRLEEESGIAIECLLFADETEETLRNAKKLLQITQITGKYIVRIRTGLNGLLRLKNDIRQCDFVIDLTYGDSFSDIYGKKAFFLYSLPKLMAIHYKIPLLIAPQTIGPFYSTWAQRLATYLLKKADRIFVRDELSKKCVHELSQRKDIIVTSDLAMGLPYAQDINKNYQKGKLNIGFNVSLLLWNKTGDDSNLKLSLSYRALIENLLEEFEKRGYVIHLIAHVYDNCEFSEYNLAEKLCKRYSNTILAPHFCNPIEAKTYMAGLDCFIGSRMHATIGAFSAGVPVIPISYSRKFEGLYNSIGYNYCVDCCLETEKSAFQKVCAELAMLDELKNRAEQASIQAQKKNMQYYYQLKQFIECSM